MDEHIDSDRGAKLFAFLAASSGYRQTNTDRKDAVEKASVADNGLRKYTRMPFGLRKALSTFQRAMNVVLATIKQQYALFYRDSIFILLKTRTELLRCIEKLLMILNYAGMTLKLKKCSFFE